MAKTKASKAAPKAGRARGPRAKATPTAKVSRRAATLQSDAGRSARSRLIELKHRLRELANPDGGREGGAAKPAAGAGPAAAEPAGARANRRPGNRASAESRLAELKRRMQAQGPGKR